MKRKRLSRMSQKEMQAVLDVIEKTVGRRGAEWKQIVKAVKAEGIEVKNWLDVRGVLQWMINEEMIVREPDIRKERYVKASVNVAADMKDFMGDFARAFNRVPGIKVKKYTKSTLKAVLSVMRPWSSGSEESDIEMDFKPGRKGVEMYVKAPWGNYKKSLGEDPSAGAVLQDFMKWMRKGVDQSSPFSASIAKELVVVAKELTTDGVPKIAGNPVTKALKVMGIAQEDLDANTKKLIGLIGKLDDLRDSKETLSDYGPEWNKTAESATEMMREVVNDLDLVISAARRAQKDVRNMYERAL